MAYKDIQKFIELLERKKQIVRVKAEVDSNLEITEITDIVSKKHGPTLHVNLELGMGLSVFSLNCFFFFFLLPQGFQGGGFFFFFPDPQTYI